jgi:hypothetical protein
MTTMLLAGFLVISLGLLLGIFWPLVPRTKRLQGQQAYLEQEQHVRPKLVRSTHFLLAIAMRLLPPSERARYVEEFRAELLDVPPTRD